MMLTGVITVCFFLNIARQCEAVTRRVHVACPIGQQARFSLGDFFRRRSVRTANDVNELYAPPTDIKGHITPTNDSLELKISPNFTADVKSHNKGNLSLSDPGRVKRPVDGASLEVVQTGTQQSEQPWCCPTTPLWLDLGQNVYPRYVQEVTCSTTSCWYGHLRCQPKLFNVQVLMRHNNECYDVRLPQELRASYAISSVSITVGCECMG